MTDQNFLETLKTKSGPNKKIIGVITLIVVLFVGGFFVFRNKITQTPPEEEKQEIKNVVTPEVVRISEDNLQKEMPANFPKDIPLNGKTRVIESYSATYPNITAKQSTISFQSSKTPKQNYDFYLKWGKDNEWKTLNNSKQENLISLYFQKNQTTLNVVINDRINITYAEI